jgi:hypothetical protein
LSDDDDPPISDDGPAAESIGSRRNERIAQQSLETLAFWRNVLHDPIGRRELWRIIADKGHAFETRFPVTPAGHPDINAIFYEIGKQDFATWLYGMLQQCDPVLVGQMHVDNDYRFQPTPKPRRKP